jgi:hypothetical protein
MKVFLAHGPSGLFDLFPFLFIGLAVWFILRVLRDGQRRVGRTAKLPTNHWSRQLAVATRKRTASDKPAGPPPDRPGMPRRSTAPHLRVLDGDAADAPALPRRFEPPPAGRRQTG